MTEAAIILGVNIVTSALKRFIVPKWGKVGVQVTVFVFALVGALYLKFEASVPGLKETLLTAIGIFSLAVSLYEVLWSRLPIFKQE